MAHILVVDDEPHIRRLVTYILEGDHQQVSVVCSGQEALAALTSGHYDLLICDINMPEINGFDVLRQVRADPRTRDLPVIMLTARGQERDVVEAMRLGAQGYITKPFRSMQLLEEVRRYIA